MANRRRTANTARHTTALAAMAGTMPSAVMTTLWHRLPMLLSAFNNPDGGRDPEFARMIGEKMQAASLGAQSLGTAAMAGQQVMTAFAMEQATANLTLSTSLATSTPDRWQQHLQAHGSKTSTRLVRLAERLAEIGSQGLSGSWKPAHTSVLANAKRLGKKKPTS